MLRIGTSGFSYDDWRGHFYPSGLKKGDMLSFYSGFFPTVEINSSYYGVPRPQTMAQMARKVGEGFDFSVKANREMTHSGRFQAEVFAQFRAALAPLADAGMLGCVLAQFPWSFRKTPENADYLERLREGLAEFPVVVEFRNAAWAEQETFERLRAAGLGYCCVDEPRLAGLVPPLARATACVGYVRFHGRNAGKWWEHRHAYERYDYLYREEELREWVPRVHAVAAGTERTYVYFNNHYQGQAAQNARQMARLLEQHLPGPAQGRLDLEGAGAN